MNRKTENELKVSLTQAIESWWDRVSKESGDSLPFVGDNVYEIMAAAALLVLVGIADTQDYLHNEEILKRHYSYKRCEEKV